jgi:phytanoyl-CoA hydroxylase
MSVREDFLKDGFIVRRKFLNREEVEDLIENTNRFIDQVIPTIPAERVYYEDKELPETLKQIQMMHEYDDFFYQLANSDKVVQLAEECLAAPVKLMNMQYFNKFPGVNVGTPVHQDGFYFSIKPQEAVTMWLSLDHADEKNGAVQYVPKSHKKGLRKHTKSSVLGFSQKISDWKEEDSGSLVQMEAAPGDILVHHSLTIHAARANRSDKSRRSIGFIFYGADTEHDAEAHSKYQKQLAQALKEEGML